MSRTSGTRAIQPSCTARQRGVHRTVQADSSADSTHVSGAAPRPFNHGAITRTCCEWNGPPNGVPSGPLLARRLLAKPLPHIPEVSRRVTAAEFGADAKLDVAAL